MKIYKRHQKNNAQNIDKSARICANRSLFKQWDMMYFLIVIIIESIHRFFLYSTVQFRSSVQELLYRKQAKKNHTETENKKLVEKNTSHQLNSLCVKCVWVHFCSIVFVVGVVVVVIIYCCCCCCCRYLGAFWVVCVELLYAFLSYAHHHPNHAVSVWHMLRERPTEGAFITGTQKYCTFVILPVWKRPSM